jgi:hypothetical protein
VAALEEVYAERSTWVQDDEEEPATGALNGRSARHTNLVDLRKGNDESAIQRIVARIVTSKG